MVGQFKTFCRTSGQDAESITAAVEIYNQCMDTTAQGALVVRIPAIDQSEKGVTFKDTPTKTDLLNAASKIPFSSLRAGSEVMATVGIQKNAFGRIYDEIGYGEKYEKDDDQAGWSMLEHGDLQGVEFPRFSVALLKYSGTTLQRKIWMPNCEIMVMTEASLVGGTPYQIDLNIKALTYDEAGNRYTVWDKD